MQKKENFLPFFIVFFILSVLLILVGQSGLFSNISSLMNKSVSPVRNATFGILTLSGLKNKTINALTLENQSLRKELNDKQSLITENKALKDQFAKSGSGSQSLLTARVVGYPGFIPGVSNPEYLVIDKGVSQGVKTGSTIIVGSYLVGRVISAEPDFSKVELVNNSSSTFGAKVISKGSEVTGVVRGRGEGKMVLDNVLLSQNLAKDQQVLTKGGRNEDGGGYPPDLIVGKIVSVEKKPSDLFQKAAVQSFVNFSFLTSVFVLE